MKGYEMLPEHMRAQTRAYVEHGQPPGDFLRAVLENKLIEAVHIADSTNQEAIIKWAQWVYRGCPCEARGSVEAIRVWIQRGGLEGKL